MWEQRENSEPRTDCRGERRRDGYTLIELVVGLSVMSVLAVAVSSAVLVSMRSVEESNSQSARIRAATSVSRQMMAEVSCAVAVPERAAGALTLAVPDRDGDGSSEEIRYWWSGTPGDPLLRRYNGGPSAALLDDIHCFQLAYDLVTITTPSSGGDLLLAGHHSAGDLSNLRIKSQEWSSQSFVASLPSGGTGFKPTRVSLYCEQVGDPGGQFTIQLRPAMADGQPGSVIYCQTGVPESDLSTSKSWQSFDLSSSGYFTPVAMLCLVLKGNVGDVCELRYHNKNVNQASYYFGITKDSGASWTITSSQALLFEVWGRVSGVSDDSGTTETVLGSVRWELQAGSGSESRIHAGAQTVNLPE